MRKVYELKRGTELIRDGEIIEFVEIRGDKAVFINSYYEELIFPDYLDIDEIGELNTKAKEEDLATPSLF